MNFKRYIQQNFINLKAFNWKLFIALCALALLPALYTTIRTFLVSSQTSTNGVDIIGQMEWFDLIDETIKAFLIIPLYAILTKLIREKRFAYITFKIGIIICLLYTLFFIGVYFYAHSLIKFMNPEETDLKAVQDYLQLETIAFIISIIPAMINVIFVVVNKSYNIYLFLIFQTVFMVIGDFVFIPRYQVNGVAYSNITANAFITVLSIVLLTIQGYLKISWFKKSDWRILKNWIHIGVFSGLQVFIDNIIYALMVVKMVNMVNEQGNYWVANNFIWTWLLIPITALAEVIKRDAAEDYFQTKETNYYLILLFIVLIWICTIPGWSGFFQVIQKLDNYQEITLIVLKLFGFYIFYALTIIPDALFIGTGKTKYNTINSLIVNLGYYGIWFLCYTTNHLKMTMDLIILMFGWGMVLHFLISQIQQQFFFKKEMFRNYLVPGYLPRKSAFRLILNKISAIKK